MLTENIVVRDDETILDVMKKMDLNALGIVFVQNSAHQFLGVITDGDIRRGVLSQKRLDLTAKNLINADCVFGFEYETQNEWIERINAKSKFARISVIPILDADKKIVDVFIPKEKFSAPISSPLLQGNELKYVMDCVETNWISSQGQYIVEFENQFAQKYGAKHALTVMNGTVALHLALHAAGIGPGDEVLVPTLTFAASVNSILYTGATPVLVDVERDSWCIDAEKARALITSKTKAIMPVHIYGQVCNMDQVIKLAREHDLKVIEDCAEAQGALWKDKAVGTIGEVGCFSFFANKIMTTGEGGMCITNNTELYQKMKILRDHGIDRSKPGYQHSMVGFNYRMTNLQAAIGLAQLEKVDFLIDCRKKIDQGYNEFFKNYGEFEIQKDMPNARKVCWLVSALYRGKKISRDQLIQALKEHSVDTRPFFLPMHEMEIYKGYARTSYPIAEELAKTGMNFPTSSSMTKPQQEMILERLKNVLDTYERT